MVDVPSFFLPPMNVFIDCPLSNTILLSKSLFLTLLYISSSFFLFSNDSKVHLSKIFRKCWKLFFWFYTTLQNVKFSPIYNVGNIFIVLYLVLSIAGNNFKNSLHGTPRLILAYSNFSSFLFNCSICLSVFFPS